MRTLSIFLSPQLPVVARRLHFTPQNQKGTASLSSPSLFSFSVRTVVVQSTQPHIWSGYLKFALLQNLLFLYLNFFSCKCSLYCPLRYDDRLAASSYFAFLYDEKFLLEMGLFRQVERIRNSKLTQKRLMPNWEFRKSQRRGEFPAMYEVAAILRI
jgi:hypothetical protein